MTVSGTGSISTRPPCTRNWTSIAGAQIGCFPNRLGHNDTAGTVNSGFHTNTSTVSLPSRKDVVFHEKYPFVRTPNIDSLRGEAVSFHNCFANYPVCVPSRSSVITGRYPHQIGVLRNSHRLPAGERDLGHHLTAHGFDCVSFGKTHNTNRGFRSVTYDKVATMGFENHGYIEDPDLITGVFGGAADEYCDFVACRQFDDYLRGRAGGGPFAAFVGIYAPHPPLYPPREYAGLYSAYQIALPPQPAARDNAVRPSIQAVPRRSWNAYPDATRREVIGDNILD